MVGELPRGVLHWACLSFGSGPPGGPAAVRQAGYCTEIRLRSRRAKVEQRRSEAIGSEATAGCRRTPKLAQ